MYSGSIMDMQATQFFLTFKSIRRDLAGKHLDYGSLIVYSRRSQDFFPCEITGWYPSSVWPGKNLAPGIFSHLNFDVWGSFMPSLARPKVWNPATILSCSSQQDLWLKWMPLSSTGLTVFSIPVTIPWRFSGGQIAKNKHWASKYYSQI